VFAERSIRIAFVAGAQFFSGAERALLLTVRALRGEGHHPFVVVGTDGELLAQLKREGIACGHVPIYFTGLRTVHRWAMSIARVVGLARAHRAEIVHANEAPTFQMAGTAARVMRVPRVTHVRFPEPAPGMSWYVKPGFDRAIFVSEYLRADAEGILPRVFGGKSDVVYDGVVLPDLPDPDTRALRRRELGIPLDRPVVAITGQVVAIKGIWEFIEAARLLASEGVAATFVVLGDDLKGAGRVRREAEARVVELGLQDRFRFLGFRPDAPSLIPLFDVIAVPSHVEPLGNATLEAMAAGRPVVGANVGGIPEMIVPGVTGLLVPAKAPVDLANALRSLLNDPARLEQMGRVARDRAATVFSLTAHARRLAEIYSALLASKERT